MIVFYVHEYELYTEFKDKLSTWFKLCICTYKIALQAI